MPVRRRLLVTALTLAALLAGGAGAPASGQPGRSPADPMPGGVVERTLPGPAALRTLGTQGLTRAAQANDVTAQRLTELLQDRTTRLTPGGRVFYADQLEADEADEADGTSDATTDGTAGSAVAASYPLDQTFSLHSRPGSSRTIHLDFDGASVAGTWWNDADGGGLPTTNVAAFSLDADRTTFNESERRLVQEVWARVAEDYAPVDVDVTTAPVQTGALTRSSSSDQTYGTQVLFAPGTEVATTLCGGQCAGVAWVDVFDLVTSWGVPGPAWVFTDLTNRAGWQLAEVASHEAGHTLALRHDGHGTAGYYGGRTPWGPIMGSSRYALTQFSNGDYTGATNQQDDLATIAQSGAPAVPDDHGNTPATTTTVLGPGTAPSTQGLIGARSDQDVFRYDHGSCAVTATVATVHTGPNLDTRLRLLDAHGTVLATSSPTVSQTSPGVVTGTGASVTLPQRPAGTVYAEVDGVGQGAMPEAGYSDYGSVGRYTLSVSGCDTTASPGTTTDPNDPNDPNERTDPVAPEQPVVAVPGVARALRAYAGARGGAVTAKVTWQPPLSDGGSPVTGYRVTALKVSSTGAVLRRLTSLRPASARAWAPRLTRGYHRFRVVTVNAVGAGRASALTGRVRAR